MSSHVCWFIINSKSGSSLGNGDTSFSVGIKLNVKMLPYATIWILLLQIQLFPFMHLQLFDYLLSKLCNRQWLPKSHSFCRCRTSYLTWVAVQKVPLPNPRLAMSVLHCSPPPVRWHPGLTNVCCWVPTSATPHWASNRWSHFLQISLWGSPVVLWLFSGVSTTVRSNWLLPRFWASVTQPPPRAASGLFAEALLDSCTTYWLLA